jgi:hypothetical protein
MRILFAGVIDLSRVFGQPDGKIIASSDGDVPEPATAVLMALGMAAILSYRGWRSLSSSPKC